MIIERANEPNRLAQLLVERVNSGDVEGLVALYEDDAILGSGDRQAVGSAPIRRFWTELLATGITVTLGQQADAIINGDLALTSTRLPGGTVTAEVARRQHDGTWKWAIDEPALVVDE
ncbi:nuclear transport factor 2 family protein [Microbacterium sp. BWT-B31]|uniref:YybH family protein n=1 Tax=Microbacterium sp. BWT-B31 TaxID=3232072 RepID=UPI0035281069